MVRNRGWRVMTYMGRVQRYLHLPLGMFNPDSITLASVAK